MLTDDIKSEDGELDSIFILLQPTVYIPVRTGRNLFAAKRVPGPSLLGLKEDSHCRVVKARKKHEINNIPHVFFNTLRKIQNKTWGVRDISAKIH
jgi:hypothetical protein